MRKVVPLGELVTGGFRLNLLGLLTVGIAPTGRLKHSLNIHCPQLLCIFSEGEINVHKSYLIKVAYPFTA